MASEFHATTGVTKTTIARAMGQSRSSLYKARKQPSKDWALKEEIETTWRQHPAYGHRRLALHLRVNKKRIRRVLRLYRMAPPRRRRKKNPRKRRQKAIRSAYPNILATYRPDAPGRAWVSDFTKLYYRGMQLNLATILDAYTREVLGWHVLTRHTIDLVLGALKDALRTHPPPMLLHADQGSEYTADDYLAFVRSLGTQPSFSAPASPWENGYMESWYDKLKVDLGDPDRYDTLGACIAAIATQMHYYNHDRIHTALKMPPSVFAAKQKQAVLALSKVETTR